MNYLHCHGNFDWSCSIFELVLVLTWHHSGCTFSPEHNGNHMHFLLQLHTQSVHRSKTSLANEGGWLPFIISGAIWACFLLYFSSSSGVRCFIRLPLAVDAVHLPKSIKIAWYSWFKYETRTLSAFISWWIKPWSWR